MSAAAYIEPWMRGPIEGVDPLTTPLLYTFQHARDDLAKWTEGLSTKQLWKSVNGLAPVGFFIHHIAGSTGRLITYLQGEALSEAQFDHIKSEENWHHDFDRATLLAEVDESFRKAEAVIRKLDSATLAEPCFIGRQKLPATVTGLLHHLGEHIIRHVGEAIITIKVVRHS